MTKQKENNKYQKY